MNYKKANSMNQEKSKTQDRNKSELTRLLGVNLRNWRTKLDLTQEVVAKIIGISRPAYVQIENGNRELYVTELSRLVQVFKIEIYKLFEFNT